MRKFAPVLVVLLAALPAAAQFESPLLSKIQPNLVNPGGKSLAMGGAFVSLADDASTGFANPAGLTQLSSWQIGAAGKQFQFTPELQSANYLSLGGGDISTTSVDSYRPKGTATELEFAALVIPVFKELTIAAYTGVNLRFNLDAADLTGGSYRAFSVNDQGQQVISIDEQGGVDIRNRFYGVSAGLRLGSRISIGGGVTLNKLEYDLTGGAAGTQHLFLSNAQNVGNPNATQPAFQTAVTATLNDSSKVGWILGAKVEILEASRLAIGAVYRRSPSFGVGYSVDATSLVNGQRVAKFSCGTDDPNIPGSGASACGGFKVPDDWAVGISGAPVKGFLVSFELQRILYSQFQNDFVPLFVYCQNPTSPCPANQRAVAQGDGKDGFLPRIGGEYTFAIGGQSDLSLRAGYYREPAHGMTLDLYPDANRDRRADNRDPLVVADPPISSAYRVSFDGGVVDNHVSFGLGATIGRMLSVDVAFDVGKASKQGVASLFLRF